MSLYHNKGTENDVLYEVPDNTHDNPENLYIKKEIIQVLERGIGKLKPKYRIVYVLKEVEGMSLLEISDCLDVSVSNVKVRLHRAKSMLKEELYVMADKNIFEFGFERCDKLVENVMKKINSHSTEIR